MKRPSFLDQKPPPGYIPGIGRGATGFSAKTKTARSGNEAFHSRTPRRLQGGSADNEENIEAEKVYADIDARLASKRKVKVENKQEKPPVLGSEFSALKRNLASVSEEQWLAIPEASDITRRNKRERIADSLQRKTYAAPDTLIMGSKKEIDLTKLTLEREKLLGREIDNVFAEVSTESNSTRDVDKLLGEMEATNPRGNNSRVEEEDVTKMRTILNSYRRADPRKSQGWIASARLEEKANHFKYAKTLIDEGCQMCPKSPDIWLENIRLNSTDIQLCKSLVAEAIGYNPSSLELWLKAVDLENININKVRVLRKALQEIPTSETLWKLVLRYEANASEKIKILTKAVELLPTSVELWSELIRHQSFRDAKKSLAIMSEKVPNDYTVAILAAEIEVLHNKTSDIRFLQQLIFARLVKISGFQEQLSAWLIEAQKRQGQLLFVGVAMVYAGMQFLEQNNNVTDIIQSKPFLVQVAELSGLVKISVYKCILRNNPAQFSIWQLLKEACEKSDDINELYETFENILFESNDDFIALKKHPILALMYAKEVWKRLKNTQRAIDIIDRALKVMPTYIDGWSAKLKIVCQSGMYDKVESVFRSAMEILDTEVVGVERIYYKHISYLRYQGKLQEALELLVDGYIPKFPRCHRLYLQVSQIYEELSMDDKSREWLQSSCKKFPHVIELWVGLSRLDAVGMKNIMRARADLDMAMLQNPQEWLLIVEKIRLERLAGNHSQAQLLIDQGLIKFPHARGLWVERIKALRWGRHTNKKTVFQDAMKSTNSSAAILAAISLDFYYDGKIETALKWMERSVKKDPLVGDGWLWLARYANRLGDKEMVNDIIKRAVDAEPVYGEEWVSVSKNCKTQYYTTEKIIRALMAKKLAETSS